MKLTYAVIKEIKKEYGDSFYLLYSDQFENNLIKLENAFNRIYSNTCIAYSYKTNYIPKLCKIIDNHGGYAEVVSSMEYKLAEKIGVKPSKIIFNGPCKEYSVIEEALIKGVLINIDSFQEYNMVKQIAEKHKEKVMKIGLRCNFDINDGVTSRFGFDINSKSFLHMLEEIRRNENLKIAGLHCHFASRDMESWKNKVKGMLDFIDCQKFDRLEYVDLGGGLFGKMKESLKKQFNCNIPDFISYAEIIGNNFHTFYKNKGYNPKLIIEPGSALAGDVLKFAAPILDIKNIRNKNIATLLGSVYNINPTLNKKNPPVEIIQNNLDNVVRDYYESIDFGGYTCIESDYLYKNFCGELALGDYVIFENIGSYSIVLKPPFILPNFAIVEYNFEKKTIELIKQAEEFSDIFCSYNF